MYLWRLKVLHWCVLPFFQISLIYYTVLFSEKMQCQGGFETPCAASKVVFWDTRCNAKAVSKPLVQQATWSMLSTLQQYVIDPLWTVTVELTVVYCKLILRSSLRAQVEQNCRRLCLCYKALILLTLILWLQSANRKCVWSKHPLKPWWYASEKNYLNCFFIFYLLIF